ncbi:MAG: CDP-alcohol phosphatidyltransferase family protein [Nanoarchaeota archaeon]
MKKTNKKDNDFEEFKNKAQHTKEEFLAILAINPITVRLAYLIKKFNLDISPNQITAVRLFILFPLAIFFLFLAPVFQSKIFYLLSALAVYFMAFTDDLDGNVARGMNKTSDFGAFLDSIADRTYTFVLIVFIFSLGMWTGHIFLVYGAVFIISLKAFHLMVISKVFYYNAGKLSMETIFSAKNEMKNLGFVEKSGLMTNLNKVLKIKRWSESIGGFERIFLTFIVPAVLFYLGFGLITLVIAYALALFNIFFYISRTKNLLLEYQNQSRTKKR